MIFKKHMILSAAFILIAWPSLAQENGFNTSSSKEPLEITADGTLEWMRESKTFIARENALAQQGTSSVKAQTLIAEYREPETGGGMQIWRVSAQKNVVLHSNESDAYGEDAVYDIDKGLATMTGGNLKMVSPDQTVTAKDKFEYWVNEGRMNAIGDAVVVRPKPEGGTDTLKADKVSAIFEDNAKGQRELSTLEATGNVVIITPDETITGAFGTYNADTNKANLTGGVKIIRGPNTLQGDRAEVDMNTSTSKIFGTTAPNAKGTGRVKGVFYPGSEKKPQAPVKTP
jgi:lipopolysaccharide export system protein LptA